MSLALKYLVKCSVGVYLAKKVTNPNTKGELSARTTGRPFYYSRFLRSAVTRALGSSAGNQQPAGHWMPHRETDRLFDVDAALDCPTNPRLPRRPSRQS
jgi:hypothetical protein